MEIISKVSKGTRMDQIYIPKNRTNFPTGSYVIIKPLEKEEEIKPFFYNIKKIEPIKIEIINNIFKIIDKLVEYENAIITGSFLEKGFHFNDIDIILITDKKLDESYIKKSIENILQIKVHLIVLKNKELISGLETDPLYILMLSKCIARKRFIYKTKKRFYYKILDLHLIKSNEIIYGFDFLNGNEKYYLTRNTIAIDLFLKHKKLTKDGVDREIERVFNVKIRDIKENILDKKEFIKKYKIIYKKLFENIMEGVKNSSK